MAAPTFFGKGALNGENSGSTITPIAFPASIAANDIAVMGVGCNNTSTFTTPTGQGSWAVLGTSLESDTGQSTEWYWLRLTGSEASESVTASATFSTTIGGYGQIWVFRGCITTGNPFEGVGNDGTVAQTTPDSTACTTTGVDRLVVCLVALDDNPAAWSSGMPPADWTNLGGLETTSVGGDWGTDGIQRTEATATTVAAAVVGTLPASIRWRTITFALIPAAAGPNEGTATGAVAWVGSATGTSVHSGTASGAISWAGSSTGVRVAGGTASGAVAWVGSADGVAPAASANQGAASGTVAWAGAATGTSVHSGAASGAITWVGAATGISAHQGAAVGTIDWVGAATGSIVHQGSATGAVTWVGVATSVVIVPTPPSLARRWRVLADDRTLAPIHDRRIALTENARYTVTTLEDRVSVARSNDRYVEATP